jgi:hypothetical protein
MRALAGRKDHVILTVLRVLLAIGAISIGVINHGITGAVVAVVCCLAYFGMGLLGRQMRQAIPSTFRFDRAILLTGLVSAPAAFLTAFAFFTASSSAPSTVYSNQSAGEWPVIIFFLAFLLAAPTYAMARTARTSEVKPLIALGLMQQSPLILAFLLEIALFSTGPNAVPMVAAGTGALLSAMVITTLASTMGAKVNGWKHLRKMKKAAGSLI